jgi:quercetin dioxygenase-like cupin family protein
MSEATVLADIPATVPVSPDGTLSRVLHTDGDLRLVGFSFDTGQELTEHAAARPAIVQVLSGRLQMTLGAKQVEVGPGDWVHMPARLPHALVALEPTVMLLTMLPPAPAPAPAPAS